MSKVIEGTDATFQSLLAATPLVLVDFYATWCGPCKNIAPFLDELSNKHTHITFVKINIDKQPATTQTFGVSSVPLFVFFSNKKEVARVSGADKKKLEETIARFDTPAEVLEGGYTNLSSFIYFNQVGCLNWDENKNTLVDILKAAPNDKKVTLKSDCDEQLLITIPFMQPVKIHSIQIEAPKDKAPSDVKLYINQPNMDFSSVEDDEPTQVITFTEPDQKVTLDYFEFQKVGSLTLFVEGNQGDEEVTALHRLTFIGQPSASMDVKDLA